MNNDDPTVSLFVKKLPLGCTEGRLIEALTECGVVENLKMLSNRRAFVDLKSGSALLQEMVAASSLQLVGLDCFVGINTSAGGRASQTDQRQLERFVCTVCQEEFKTERKLTAHMVDGNAHKKPAAAWCSDQLAQFDLSPNTMVAAMSEPHRELLEAYMLHSAPRWPELPKIVHKLATDHPTSLRLKEFIETLEAFNHIGHFVWEQTQLKSVDCILDLACGHGLLGVMLAYRFPHLKVQCVDLEPRAATDHLIEAWRAIGSPAEGHDLALQKLEVLKADVNDVEYSAGTVACCIHACNEANLIVLRKSEAAGASFAVMPCCIPEGIYGTACHHLPDATRYATMLGVIAGRFCAQKVCAIDERITNRNLIAMGPRHASSNSAPGEGDDDIALTRTCRGIDPVVGSCHKKCKTTSLSQEV